jgi:putative aldouronate transport system permease protein
VGRFTQIETPLDEREVSAMRATVTARKKKSNWKSMLPFYVMAMPGLVYMICNNYLPMAGIVIAFKSLDLRKGIFRSEWSGFENFRFLFASSDAWVITRNTILYNAAFIVLGTIVSVFVAIMINEIRQKTALRIYQSLVLLPFLMSWIIVNYLVYSLLSADSGMINNAILIPLGIKPISWYNSKEYWPFILIFCHLWKSTGYSMVIYLASIVGMSQDYFEAATIDGASKIQKIKSITLPLLKPTVITMFILSLGRIFYSDFGLFYQVTRNSGPIYSVTRTIDVYVYNALMNNSDFAMSSAASAYQSVVGFALILCGNWLVGKFNRENAMF